LILISPTIDIEVRYLSGAELLTTVVVCGEEDDRNPPYRIRSRCAHGLFTELFGTCGVNAFVKDDRVVKLEPASFPDPGYERICLKGIAMATQRIHHPDG